LKNDKIPTLDELMAKITPENQHEEVGFDVVPVTVKIKRLRPDAVVPKYVYDGDAGFDLVAVENVIIEPGETKLVPTGLAVELPPGYELQIRPRSGVTLKTKLRVQLGTVDAGYRGEIGVIVDNIAQKERGIEDGINDWGELYVTTHEIKDRILHTVNGEKEVRPNEVYLRNTYIIRKGDRIAQGVITPFTTATFVEVDELSDTTRGVGGFGSTGVKSKSIVTKDEVIG